MTEEQGGFFSVSTRCVCMSSSVDVGGWGGWVGAERGRGECGTAQTRAPSA